MTKEELFVIQSLLKEVLVNQQDSSCNDYFMAKTPENIQMMNILNDFSKQEPAIFSFHGDGIAGLDLVVTEYALSIVDRELAQLK